MLYVKTFGKTAKYKKSLNLESLTSIDEITEQNQHFKVFVCFFPVSL